MGIFSNVILFLVKLLCGIATSSIAIMTDAINNLSDMSSSVITVVGFKLASMPSDDEHPYGHARFEYISGMLVACIIFMVGIQFFISSLEKTLNPQSTKFSVLVLILLILSVLTKIWQSYFYKKLGKEISSNVLIATSVDSRNDVLSTIVLLISIVVEHITGWKLDGPIGMIVSVFVLYSGVGILRDTLTPLIGQAPKKKTINYITEKIKSYPNIIGVHDLIVHNYGPDNLFASVHVEMSAEQGILDSHETIDKIERKFLRDDGINLLIHHDPVITDTQMVKKYRDEVIKIAGEIDNRLHIHDFRLVSCDDDNRLIFDISVPDKFELADDEIRSIYGKKISEKYGNFKVIITVDRNYTSTVN